MVPTRAGDWRAFNEWHSIKGASQKEGRYIHVREDKKKKRANMDAGGQFCWTIPRFKGGSRYEGA